MTVTVVNIIPRKFAEASQSAQYTAPSLTKCRIDKFTVTNSTGVAATIAVNLVVSGGTASAANVVLATRSIAAGEAFEATVLVGQVLSAGGFISTLAGTASALTISATGTEIT